MDDLLEAINNYDIKQLLKTWDVVIYQRDMCRLSGHMDKNKAIHTRYKHNYDACVQSADGATMSKSFTYSDREISKVTIIIKMGNG